MNCRILFGASVLLSLLSRTCCAVDAMSVTAGSGDSTNLLRLDAQWSWSSQWWKSNGGYLGGYWDLSLADWRATKWLNMPNNDHQIADIGFTPVFRYRGYGNSGYYVDGGIGIHQFSTLYDNGGRQLSTRFEFGDIVGVGYRFVSGWECGAGIEHYSNGGISHPNSGINIIALRVSKLF